MLRILTGLRHYQRLLGMLSLVMAGVGIERLWAKVNHAPPQRSAVEQRVVEMPRQRPSETTHAPGPFESEDAPVSPRGAHRTGKSSTFEAAAQLTIADDALRAGDYQIALRAYEQILAAADGPPTAALLYRLGLTAEGLGDPVHALKLYSRIHGTAGDSPWAGLALLGQTRCWLAQRQQDLVLGEVVPRLLVDRAGLSEQVRQELWHLVAAAVSRDSLLQTGAHATGAGTAFPLDQEAPVADLLDDRALHLPPWRVDAAQLLERTNALLLAAPPAMEPSGLTLIQNLDDTPAGALLAVGDPAADAELLIAGAAQLIGWRVACSPLAVQQLGERKVRVSVRDVSLALLLDGLCLPRRLVWQQSEGLIVIRAAHECSAAEWRAAAHARAERLLEQALLRDPVHPLAVWNRLAWSVLLSRTGSHPAAATILRDLADDQIPTEYRAVAAFNLGKCQIVLGEESLALQAFLECVDHGVGDHLVQAAAYLYVGRLQLEQFQPREALFACTRGLSLTSGAELAGEAALLLACAQLMAGHPQGANAVLMEHRGLLAADPYRDRAAFLTCLSRHEAAVIPDVRHRETRQLTMAVSHVRPEEGFGAQWWLLVGTALERAGLTESAAQTYREGLAKIGPLRVKSELLMRLSRLDDAFVPGAANDAVQSVLNQTDHEPLRWSMAVQAAERTYRQQQWQDCLDQCADLLRECPLKDLRRQALGLMGRCYHALGDYRSAIACFSGTIPATDERDTPGQISKTPGNGD
jgi:tetratricopeptide (TPR) repeat protein